MIKVAFDTCCELDPRVQESLCVKNLMHSTNENKQRLIEKICTKLSDHVYFRKKSNMSSSDTFSDANDKGGHFKLSHGKKALSI